MKHAALICGLSMAPISAHAYADFICATADNSIVFVIDLSGQTITKAGSEPIRFQDAPLSAYPLTQTMTAVVVGRVDLPLPAHIKPGGVLGFALAQDTDDTFYLFENFAQPSAPFASVEDIMAGKGGIPCHTEVAD